MIFGLLSRVERSRDVKPNNLVMRRDGYYVLTDLGLGASLADGAPPPTGRVGSRGYWAPEVLRRDPQGYPVDWWSLGVSLLYAATGIHPFRVRHPACDYAAVAVAAAAEKASADNHAPDEDPPAATVGEAWGRQEATLAAEEHAPVVDGSSVNLTDAELNANTLHMPLDPNEWGLTPHLTSLIAGLLTRDPAQRLGSGDGGTRALMDHPFFDGVHWQLLREEALPAPFLPDPYVVYAKDCVPALSDDGANAVGHVDVAGSPSRAQPTALSEALHEWDYVSGHVAYARELRELVRKSPPESLGCD